VEIPTGFGQANFVFTGACVPTGAEVTLGVTTSDFVGTPTEAAEALWDAWALDMSDMQNTACVLTEVRLKYGPTATGPTGVFGGSEAGHLATSGTSSAVALLVAKTTSFGGRAGKGRMFVPGMSEPDVTVGGAVDSAFLAFAQGKCDAFHASLVAADLEPRLLHSADSPLSTPTLIDAFVVQGTVATQRRRQRR
jgi:hypothetical protein